ncbi:MAG TPA: hypothetical protein P5567_08645 [Kiritimatiellia bacterium]|nr:hypothetical protein [Kiritimatiellia bacterium]HRZ12510.1 hypothetical protein [Kiritimatiellia bacterium]HSA17732.1 hypothetical protein [Kiritimatiellia bacterium]
MGIMKRHGWAGRAPVATWRKAIHLAALLVGVTGRIGRGQDADGVALDVTQLKTLAQQHEQAGEKQAAADIYEIIMAREPSSRQILAARLAILCAEMGATNKALAWAHEVASANPDPEAYLAGIYEKLGDLTKAQAILKDLVQQEAGSRVMLARFWQLAAVYEKMGQLESSEAMLKRAYEAASSPAEKDCAVARWNQFKQRRETSLDVASPVDPAVPSGSSPMK